MSKLNPQVFRDAAERISGNRNSACCSALDGICKTLTEADRYIEFLAEHFCPEHKPFFWWDEDEDYDPREARILALLLCAEMCKR